MKKILRKLLQFVENTVEFSAVFIMKQDFDIGALGYHCYIPLSNFR